MSKCCLNKGRFCDACDEKPAGITAIYYLTADGEIHEVAEIPDLSEDEGIFMYSGELYAEPLEIKIEYIKADNAEKWLEAVLLRHIERVRYIDESLFVWTEIKEVGE